MCGSQITAGHSLKKGDASLTACSMFTLLCPPRDTQSCIMSKDGEVALLLFLTYCKISTAKAWLKWLVKTDAAVCVCACVCVGLLADRLACCVWMYWTRRAQLGLGGCRSIDGDLQQRGSFVSVQLCWQQDAAAPSHLHPQPETQRLHQQLKPPHIHTVSHLDFHVSSLNECRSGALSVYETLCLHACT